MDIVENLSQAICAVAPPGPGDQDGKTSAQESFQMNAGQQRVLSKADQETSSLPLPHCIGATGPARIFAGKLVPQNVRKAPADALLAGVRSKREDFGESL